MVASAPPRLCPQMVRDVAAARNLDLSDASVGVVVIGHGAPRQETIGTYCSFSGDLTWRSYRRPSAPAG